MKFNPITQGLLKFVNGVDIVKEIPNLKMKDYSSKTLKEEI